MFINENNDRVWGGRFLGITQMPKTSVYFSFEMFSNRRNRSKGM
jgi:hypothetical protein